MSETIVKIDAIIVTVIESAVRKVVEQAAIERLSEPQRRAFNLAYITKDSYGGYLVTFLPGKVDKE